MGERAVLIEREGIGTDVISAVNGEADDLCFVVAVVIGDLNGEGIRAVEVGIGDVGPCAGAGVDGSGAVCCRRDDDEIGGGGTVVVIGECEGASDG